MVIHRACPKSNSQCHLLFVRPFLTPLHIRLSFHGKFSANLWSRIERALFLAAASGFRVCISRNATTPVDLAALLIVGEAFTILVTPLVGSFLVVRFFFFFFPS